MNCPLCHYPLAEGTMFCGSCGNRVPRCPTCGRVLQGPGKFCPHDGTPIPEDVLAVFNNQTPAAKPTDAPRKKTSGAEWIVMLIVLLVGAALVWAAYSMDWFDGNWKDDDNGDPSGYSDADDEDAGGSLFDWFSGGQTQTDVTAATEATEPTETTQPTQTEVVYESRYEIIQSDMTWLEAKAACEARGGHLATITSRQEYEEICRLANETELVYLWVGASLPSVNAQWSEIGWITGEGWSFERWYPGEPSRQDADGTYETYLSMWTVNDGDWTFNDQRNDLVAAFPSTSGVVGYVYEYKVEVIR